MLEIILLIVGIMKAVRSFGLRKLTAHDFPDVDPGKFAEWHQAQLRETNIFLWATWGAFFIKLVLRLAARETRLSFEGAIAFIVLILLGWIAGLIFWGVQFSRARKLREAAGINWPHRDAYAALTSEAAAQFRGLRNAGRLPGIARDEHGNLETQSLSSGKNVVYPVAITFHVTKEHDEARYSYVLTKASSATQWELARAWRTEASGQREYLNIELDATTA